MKEIQYDHELRAAHRAQYIQFFWRISGQNYDLFKIKLISEPYNETLYIRMDATFFSISRF